VRVMDAQTRVRDTAALVALVQSLVRHDALGEPDDRPPVSPEVLEENRFLAARDGMRAAIVAPAEGGCVPVRHVLERLLRECEPHADRLGCAEELAALRELAAHPGDVRQRAIAARSAGLAGVVRALHDDFVAPHAERVVPA
jgi:glutamate---cysteine ligase / carboxylate-amine ligase